MPMPGFLGQDVGGYAQGPMPSGQAGVPQSGIGYGDILKAAVQYGSKPGSSGPMIAGAMPGGVTGGGALGQPATGAPNDAMLNPPQKKSSIEALIPIFAGMLGL